jgi:hypothetical protein
MIKLLGCYALLSARRLIAAVVSRKQLKLSTVTAFALGDRIHIVNWTLHVRRLKK